MGMTLFYPGTFDPFTTGHANIVQRAVNMGFNVVIGIGKNTNKTPMFSPEQRLEAISNYYIGNPNVTVVEYDGLTADAVAKYADGILRGIRNGTDFDYENTIAHVNRQVNTIETVFLPAIEGYFFVSSTLVKELYKNGEDVSKYVIDTFKPYL